jgi:type I restriction enzyme S subunit
MKLPIGWKSVKLGELFEERVENNCAELELLSITGTKGIIPRSEIEGKDNSCDNKSNYLKVCKGDIAYNTMRMWQGVSALSDYNGIVSPAYTVLKPINSVCKKYFSYFFKLQHTIFQFYRHSQGLVDDTRNLKYKNFKKILVCVPPLPEQRAIAEILTTADKVIASKERLITAKQKQKQWLIQNLLTGKIRLPGFSGEWKKKRLGNVCEIIMGQSPSSESYNICGVGMPLIQGNADIKNRKTIIRTFTSQVTKTAQKDDIIMTVRAPVGEIATATFDCCIGRGVCSIKGNDYIYYYLEYFESKWYKLSQGSTFDSITGIQLKKLFIMFPPILEQHTIAAVLSTTDREIELLKKELEQQKLIKKHLMQKLLTGKIRVREANV